MGFPFNRGLDLKRGSGLGGSVKIGIWVGRILTLKLPAPEKLGAQLYDASRFIGSLAPLDFRFPSLFLSPKAPFDGTLMERAMAEIQLNRFPDFAHAIRRNPGPRTFASNFRVESVPLRLCCKKRGANPAVMQKCFFLLSAFSVGVVKLKLRPASLGARN